MPSATEIKDLAVCLVEIKTAIDCMLYGGKFENITDKHRETVREFVDWLNPSSQRTKDDSRFTQLAQYPIIPLFENSPIATKILQELSEEEETKFEEELSTLLEKGGQIKGFHKKLVMPISKLLAIIVCTKVAKCLSSDSLVKNHLPTEELNLLLEVVTFIANDYPLCQIEQSPE